MKKIFLLLTLIISTSPAHAGTVSFFLHQDQIIEYLKNDHKIDLPQMWQAVITDVPADKKRNSIGDIVNEKLDQISSKLCSVSNLLKNENALELDLDQFVAGYCDPFLTMGFPDLSSDHRSTEAEDYRYMAMLENESIAQDCQSTALLENSIIIPMQSNTSQFRVSDIKHAIYKTLADHFSINHIYYLIKQQSNRDALTKLPYFCFELSINPGDANSLTLTPRFYRNYSDTVMPESKK